MESVKKNRRLFKLFDNNNSNCSKNNNNLPCASSSSCSSVTTTMTLSGGKIFRPWDEHTKSQSSILSKQFHHQPHQYGGDEQYGQKCKGDHPARRSRSSSSSNNNNNEEVVKISKIKCESSPSHPDQKSPVVKTKKEEEDSELNKFPVFSQHNHCRRRRPSGRRRPSQRQQQQQQLVSSEDGTATGVVNSVPHILPVPVCHSSSEQQQQSSGGGDPMRSHYMIPPSASFSPSYCLEGGTGGESPVSPTSDSDYLLNCGSSGESHSNLFLYPLAINELANLSRNELTAIGLLPPEPPTSHHKAKRQRPKRFHCPHCQVAFSNNGQLRGHIRIHTGERPFVCEEDGCGKSFTRNEELTRHRRIHTGLRPFPCTFCGKKFGRKDHLKKHTRTHQRVMYTPTSMIGYGHPFQPFHPPILSSAVSSNDHHHHHQHHLNFSSLSCHSMPGLLHPSSMGPLSHYPTSLSFE